MPHFNYSAVAVGDEVYLMASDLVEATLLENAASSREKRWLSSKEASSNGSKRSILFWSGRHSSFLAIM